MAAPTGRRPIVVLDYDPEWATIFEQLRLPLETAVGDLALAIEHVGSTSVPGLAAKPIIDIDIVVAPEHVPEGIARLATLGYEHRGNLGIPEREAFRAKADLPPHNLYLCPAGSAALENHLSLRNHLRRDPDAVREYGELKRELARRHPDDIDSYVEGKTEFILAILRRTGFPDEGLAAVERVNRKSRG